MFYQLVSSFSLSATVVITVDVLEFVYICYGL
jgi:hypothetical protein